MRRADTVLGWLNRHTCASFFQDWAMRTVFPPFKLSICVKVGLIYLNYRFWWTDFQSPTTYKQAGWRKVPSPGKNEWAREFHAPQCMKKLKFACPPVRKRGRYLMPPSFFSWEMQEGGHLMHPEVKLGVSGGRADAFTVLTNLWKCIDISHMGTEGIFIISTSLFLNFPSFSCYIIRWHLRLWPPAYHMTRWYLLS